MRRYIEQLIEDLDEAINVSSTKLDLLFNKYEGDEHYIYLEDDEAGITISDLIGIDQIYFPQSGYVDDNEAEHLVNKIIEVYYQYGINPIFHHYVGNKVKYEHLRLSMSCHVYPVKGEVVDIELCDYLPHNCPLHDMCLSEHAVTCFNEEAVIQLPGTNLSEMELTQ